MDPIGRAQNVIRRRARLAWIVGTLIVAGVVVIAIVFGRSGPQSPGSPQLTVPGAPPGLQAQTACANLREVQQLIRTNGAASRVLAFLDAAQTQINAAVAGDPSWLSLQSGIASLERGLRRDDTSATEVGIAIVRDQCRRAGVDLFPKSSA